MSDNQVSIQLYSVRDSIAENLDSTLAKIAEIGYRQVELYSFTSRADEYAELLPTYNLTAPSAHEQLLGRDVRAVFEAATRLKIPTVIDPHIDRALWTNRGDVSASARALNEIAAIGADFGVEVGYHNHWWEIRNRIDGARALDVFVDLLDDRVVLEIDTFWVERAGDSAPDLLRQLGDRVKFIHVKDGRNEGDLDTGEQTAVGAGDLDIPSILEAAQHALWVVELEHLDGDMFAALSSSFDFVHRFASSPAHGDRRSL